MRVNTFVAKEKERPHDVVENVCGVLVHARPAELDHVRVGLGELPGVEIHQVTDDGRLIVTVEDAEGQWAGATISRFNDIRGVLSVALVYHHFDSDLEGEIRS
ncbi:MAG TPA: chaperone NapD [Candidatus Omnitrophota bacterium]|nr:chaperone NapD [Candidatus Omnitrophota bacterium]